MRRQHRDLKDVEAKMDAMSRHLDFAPNPGSPKDELSALSGSVSLDQLESLPVDDIGAAKHTLQLCWRELCGLRDHDSFARANPRLPVNQAHIRVSDWLRRAEVAKLFENGLSHSIFDDESNVTCLRRRSFGDPNSNHDEYHTFFIISVVNGLPHQKDIFPLAIRTLKQGISKSPEETQMFADILKSAYWRSASVGAELDLRMAGLCLYCTDPPSPDEFMELLTAIHDHSYHQLRVEHPLEDVQDRISRMHRLAQRCAQLLGDQDSHEDAEKVLAMVERVYNDGFLAYQRWNHGQDIPILEQDDATLAKLRAAPKKTRDEAMRKRNIEASSDRRAEKRPPPRTPVSGPGSVRASAPGFRGGPRDPLLLKKLSWVHKTRPNRNDGVTNAHRFIDVMHTLSEQLGSATIPAGGLPREATEDVHGADKGLPGSSSQCLKRLEGLAFGKDWHKPMHQARRTLLKYYRLLDLTETPVGYDDKSIEKAKAVLAADDAGQRVFEWITSSSPRKAFDHPSYSSSEARDVLILAIEVIVGAGYWRKPHSWLHTSARAYGEHDMAAAARLQMRRDLFEDTIEAIYRWDFQGTVSGNAFKFLALCTKYPHRYIDIAPLISRALEKSSRRDAWRAASFDKLLLWKHRLVDHRGAIELQTAVLDLCHEVPTSRWGLKNLLADIQSDNRHPLRPENQRGSSDISIRMHCLAAAYAELHKDANGNGASRRRSASGSTDLVQGVAPLAQPHHVRGVRVFDDGDVETAGTAQGSEQELARPEREPTARRTRVDILVQKQGTHRPDGTKRSIGNAKAALVADEAGPRLCRWLSQTTVRVLFENRLYHERVDTMGGDAFLEMLQLRCYLFTSILQAIHRWDPEAATTDAHDFLTTFAGENLWRHIDIAPLIIRALEEVCRHKPAHDAEHLKKLLHMSKHELLGSRDALKLQTAVLALNHPSQPSPTEFQRLLIELLVNDDHTLCIECQ
ncbi:hypothetical protein PG984_006974 [Apiospora sp. TS-2023a]